MSKQDYVYGTHAVVSLIENEPERIIELYALKGKEDSKYLSIINTVKQYGISVVFVNRKTLDDKVFGGVPQGLVAKVKSAKELGSNELSEFLSTKNEFFFLILDNVTDPHNLGACLRNCDGAGVDAIICAKDKSAPLSSTAKKVACGAAEHVPVFYVTNLARTLDELHDNNVHIVGTAGETEKLVYDVDLKGSLAIVMGAEETGMRRLTREKCDEIVKLPMYGTCTSLNVSVATGICLYEVVRQRLGK
jgi:23S rRNA (guanosine2251-2'-O)-methyltransferase